MRRLVLLLALVPSLASAAISLGACNTQASGTGTSQDASALPTIANGDIAIAFAVARNTANAMSTSTTGWNSIVESTTTNVRYGIWYMRYTGSEATITITRSSAGTLTRWGVVVCVLSGAYPTGSPVDVIGTVTEAASAATVAAVTTGYANSWPLGVTFIASSSTTACSNESGATPTEWTDQTIGSSTNRGGLCVLQANAAQVSAGSTGTTSVTFTGTYGAHVLLAIREDANSFSGSGGMNGFFP